MRLLPEVGGDGVSVEEYFSPRLELGLAAGDEGNWGRREEDGWEGVRMEHERERRKEEGIIDVGVRSLPRSARRLRAGDTHVG